MRNRLEAASIDEMMIFQYLHSEYYAYYYFQ